MVPWLLLGVCAAALIVLAYTPSDKQDDSYEHHEQFRERRTYYRQPLEQEGRGTDSRGRGPVHPGVASDPRVPKEYSPPTDVEGHREDSSRSHLADERSLTLREQAREHGNRAAQCFRESQDAWNRGDRAAAKRFSDQGKEHKQRMTVLDAEACEQIFQANNAKRKGNEIDLHGLYVNEAVAKSLTAVEKARKSGLSKVRFIVGKGRRSEDGVPKIKPALEKALSELSIRTQIDLRNDGVLEAHLTG
ncbi:DUF1771-domain-containing protein [Leucogyrophana mollusca]|uniref:DUF1771-domain-containing protein n=1 Tax=Leucogyrophana mollusca TaxID=85980 RepID=A0ACB8BLD7_9AGAM|nr:DUF1771-domain-containing protein [Leucogyrophana mollusca]